MSQGEMKAYEEATQLAQQGRYAEALERHLWFHDNAPPSCSAVRLSFGLMGWKRLAEKYPPAHAALVELRDENEDALRTGDDSFRRFQELAAVHEALNEVARTGDAFLTLRAFSLEMARRCYDQAEKGLVACGVFELCSEYIPDAIERFRHHQSARRDMLALPPDSEPEHQESYFAVVETRFADDIVRLIQILLMVGRTAEAEQVRELAIQETDNATAKERIRNFGIEPLAE